MLPRIHRFRRTFETLESRCLLSSTLPFNDSSLAPPGLAATCALPNLPVFDVKDYGATGNGVTDDTVAIRNALTAAEAAGGGIIYLPAGTYDVCPQPGDPYVSSNPIRPIFSISSSDIVFMGEGENETHLEGYCPGLQNPVTNWTITGLSNGYNITRFTMFYVDSDAAALSTIQFRSLDVCGNAGYTSTGVGNPDTNPVTGDGWDMTNKCICMTGANTINNVLVFNCTLHDFRGEIVYQGGTNPGSVSIINCDIYGSNADGISCGSDMLVAYTTLGGDTPGSDLCNGVENFCMANPEQLVVEDCSISSSSSSNPLDLHGNGIVYMAPTACALSVTGCTITDCQFGIELAYFGHNITIENNAFSDNQERGHHDNCRVGADLCCLAAGLEQYHDFQQQLR